MCSWSLPLLSTLVLVQTEFLHLPCPLLPPPGPLMAGCLDKPPSSSFPAFKNIFIKLDRKDGRWVRLPVFPNHSHCPKTPPLPPHPQSLSQFRALFPPEPHSQAPNLQQSRPSPRTYPESSLLFSSAKMSVRGVLEMLARDFMDIRTCSHKYSHTYSHTHPPTQYIQCLTKTEDD